MRSDVSVLYVDPRGPYPNLVTDWWDEKRDARNYAGPNPIVAHPPCGPWGPWAHLCRHQDKSAAIIAFESVRIWGGVLEHPADSRAFDHHLNAAPHAGEWPDRYGGRTYVVDQCAWGHVCRKWTWLYVVGVADDVVQAGIRHGGTPTRVMTHGPWNRTGLPEASKEQRRRTPVAFAEWLIELAAQARR